MDALKNPAPSANPPFLLWPMLIGFSGFAAGFFGPIAFLPDSNIAPVIGIFFTGPGGVVLGCVLALVANRLDLAAARRWRLLVGTSIAVAVAVLAWCISAPTPKLHGRVIEASIAACTPATDLTAESIAHWQKRIAAANWAEPRAGWKESAPRLLADDGGVVLELRVQRQQKIHEQRKIWNRGELRASGWQTPEKAVQRFYTRHAGASCEAYAIGTTAQYYPVDEGTAQPARGWPPANAANFLDLMLLQPVPAAVRGLL